MYTHHKLTFMLVSFIVVLNLLLVGAMPVLPVQAEAQVGPFTANGIGTTYPPFSMAADASWTGMTFWNEPMSFKVINSGTQWSTFKLKAVFAGCSASGTIEITVFGPGNITNDQFSYSGSTFSFTGQFTSPFTATGTYSFNNHLIVVSLPYPPYVCYVHFNQSGTWSASTPVQPPSDFSKSGPINGALNQSASPTLTWGSSSNAASYEYCYDTTNDNACSAWTSAGAKTSASLSGLSANTVYYWHVRAVNVGGTTYSNGNSTAFWSFITAPLKTYTLSGRAGTSNAMLTYLDGTVKTVTADGNGNYSIIVPSGWSGTVTPSKVGYSFSPINRVYTNVVTDQTAQNYIATAIAYIISGNVGIGGVTLSYTDGIPKTVMSDGSGNYSLSVSYGWSGTVTPYRVGYSFSPANKTYVNVTSHQTAQNYLATLAFHAKDTTGVFRPSNGLLYLKNTNATGFADIAINYGTAGDYPVAGDWNGDGIASIGIYRNGFFYLRNSNTIGFADLVFAFGQLGDQPVAGDWDGNGTDTIGVYRPSTGQFLLRNSNTSGVEDMSFYLGNVGDVGIAGDWNGDGKDTTGVFRPSNGVIFLKNTNATGFADAALNYGLAGDQPVTGDWNGDGIDTIGVYRNGQFLLRNSNTIGFADLVFALGNPGDMPIAGDWDGIP
jgi:hypothetical protein